MVSFLEQRGRVGRALPTGACTKFGHELCKMLEDQHPDGPSIRAKARDADSMAHAEARLCFSEASWMVAAGLELTSRPWRW